MQIPHSMTPERGMSDQFETHVELEQAQVIHPYQQISSVQHSILGLIGQEDQRGEDQITTVHQKYTLTLPELYNSVACDIFQIRTCMDKGLRQHHLLQ